MNVNQLSNDFIGSASNIYALIGDTVTYTFVIQNNSNDIFYNSLFTDVLPSSLDFVDGSVKINNTPQILDNPNLGINLGMISPNQTSTVSFEAIVISNPGTQIITTTATLNYDYSNITPSSVIITSNIIPITFINLNIDISLTSDKSYAVVGENIAYTVIVSNLGSIDITTPIITNFIPVGISFIPGSVVVDGLAQPNTVSPTTGITLPNIDGGDKVVVKFMANVLANPPAPVSTQSSIIYEYVPMLGIPAQTVTQESNILILLI